MKYTIKSGEVVATGTWPKTDTAALKECVEKYKFIVAAIDDGKKPPRCHTDSCALCKLHFHNGCKGCPVLKATGEKECLGSPWEWYTDNLSDWRIAQAAAAAEIQFLKSLLDEQ